MRKRTHVLLKRIVIRSTILICCSGALYVYFRTGTFTIHDYRITGTTEEQAEELKKQFGFLADQRIMKLLPGNRVLSYHDDEIRTLITETLPNTSDITLYPSGPHTLTVKIESYTPIFAVSETHAISENGTVYKEIVPIDTFAQLSISTSTEVSQPLLFAMKTLASNIDTVLFKVHYIAIDEFNDIRFFDESKKTNVVVSGDADMTRVWSNIVSAVDTDPLKKNLLEKKDLLEYIDTRFGNKVFYKFTNTSVPVIIPPHEMATTTIQ